MNKRYEGEKRTDKLEIRIEPALKELIEDIAFSEGVKVSEYVRLLLIKEVEHKNRIKLLRDNK